MDIRNEIVPKDKLEVWEKILLESGGEYLGPPKEDKDNPEWLRVDYKITDLRLLMAKWNAVFSSPLLKGKKQKNIYYAIKRYKA